MKRVMGLSVLLLVAAVCAVSAGEQKEQVKQMSPEVSARALDRRAERVDINSATEAELKAVPGIDEALAKKIIAGRPYVRKDLLVMKNIVSKETYDKIRDHIRAKQTPAMYH